MKTRLERTTVHAWVGTLLGMLAGLVLGGLLLASALTLLAAGAQAAKKPAATQPARKPEAQPHISHDPLKDLERSVE